MSKVGFHISAGSRRGLGSCLKQCAEAGNPLPVIFSVDQDIWPDLARFSPQTVCIFRTQKTCATKNSATGRDRCTPAIRSRRRATGCRK